MESGGKLEMPRHWRNLFSALSDVGKIHFLNADGVSEITTGGITPRDSAIRESRTSPSIRTRDGGQ